MASRPASAGPIRMVDLGCGDLGLMAPVLRRLPLGSYLGLDLSPDVLPLAQAALGHVPYPCQWRQGDLITWAGTEPSSNPVDLIHSSFALHHLSDAQKLLFLQRSQRHLAEGGMMLWADVFREPGESRSLYVQRYVERIRQEWAPLKAEQQHQVIEHLRTCDTPADRKTIQAEAEILGWQWQWQWRGRHQSEALASLTVGEGPTASAQGVHEGIH